MFDVLATSTVRSSERRASSRIDEMRQPGQHFGHLVAALAAADVDDDVGIGPLAELLVCIAVFQVPNPPGIPHAPPRGSGKNVSSTRWPVSIGMVVASRSANGRARRTRLV